MNKRLALYVVQMLPALNELLKRVLEYEENARHAGSTRCMD